MAGIVFDPGKPRAYRRKGRQVETAEIGHVRIGIERDVGDALDITSQERSLLKLLVHHAQRPVSAVQRKSKLIRRR